MRDLMNRERRIDRHSRILRTLVEGGRYVLAAQLAGLLAVDLAEAEKVRATGAHPVHGGPFAARDPVWRCACAACGQLGEDVEFEAEAK